MKAFYRPPDRGKYLLADEIKKLLDAAKETGEREARFLGFMANTGVRPSESRMVIASHIYPAESRVKVFTIKQKKEGKEKVDPKPRDVDLSPIYARELAGWVKGVEGSIFPFSRYTMWRIFKRVAVKAGLNASYTLYSLRHSRAIYLLEWTGDLDYTSKQMGHSSIEVTRSYLHCLPSKREEYVRKKLKAF